MIAQELEVSLHMAFVEARQKRHEFITVEHLGVDQREAMQMNLEPLFDGFLIGQGVMQKWRQPEGEETT